MMRKITSDARFGAAPQRNDARVKPAVDHISNRLRPNVLASHPVIGRMMALATRYDVNAHVASSVVADRLLAMCGSDTFTTVVSSTSMKVANITARATIQGLTGVLIAVFVGAGLWTRPRSSPRAHGGRHRHPWPQQVIGILPRLE